MKMKVINIVCLVLIYTNIYGQKSVYSGSIKDKKNNEPIEFVSIGIVGKDIGTVSSADGSYALEIAPEYDKDSIKFSCIGYLPYVEEVEKYKSQQINDIFLEPKDITLREVVINQLDLKERILGNKYKKGVLEAGFLENEKGFECGVLLKINKKTYLQQLICNITRCTYDSIMYRVNVYDVVADNDFVNILEQPIYIKQKTSEKNTLLEIDLSQYNIMVENNTLVTLEHITDMGSGRLLFPASIFKGSTCYSRKTSQAEWRKLPVKLGISVKVLEEASRR